MFDPRTQHDHTYFSYKDTRLVHNNNNCVDFSCDEEEVVQFRPNNQESIGSDDSGVCSPPLWKNTQSPSSPSPNPSPSRSPYQPLLNHHGYKSLSPNTRAQSIARGQKELMEMVKNMPESSYELSLKDLVEYHHQVDDQRLNLDGKNQVLKQRGVVVRVKKQDSKKNEVLMRSGSFENKGLFLKMGFFPFNYLELLFKKKKKKFGGGNNVISGKVSPKLEGVKGNIGGERDWWKKKFTGSSDSDSSRISSNSGGTTESSGGSSGRSYGGGGRRKTHGFLRGCWSLFQSKSTNL